MGILDDALKQFTQGGGNAQQQPLIVVLQELLVGKPQQPGARQASQQQEAEVPQSSSAPQAGGGGLGGVEICRHHRCDAARCSHDVARSKRCARSGSGGATRSAPPRAGNARSGGGNFGRRR